MDSRELLEAFDRYLAGRGLQLRAILPWLEQQDGHPGWPAHVRATLADLGRGLGHGV